MRVNVVRKWPLRGKSFVCWNITRVSLWLLCNVNFVQSIRPTIATWPRWTKGTDDCSSEEYRCTHVDACVARTWISYRWVPCHPWCTRRIYLVVKKLFQFFCGCEQFHWGRWFGFLVINVCIHGEHYETPCGITLNWGLAMTTFYPSEHSLLAWTWKERTKKMKPYKYYCKALIRCMLAEFRLGILTLRGVPDLIVLRCTGNSEISLLKKYNFCFRG
jgi:hypothetical protein